MTSQFLRWGQNLELQALFNIIESKQFPGASKIKSNVNLADFKSGWLQNVEVDDFDKDGQVDLFFFGPWQRVAFCRYLDQEMIKEVMSCLRRHKSFMRLGPEITHAF
jgi:hypothetical protein